MQSTTQSQEWSGLVTPSMFQRDSSVYCTSKDIRGTSTILHDYKDKLIIHPYFILEEAEIRHKQLS